MLFFLLLILCYSLTILLIPEILTLLQSFPFQKASCWSFLEVQLHNQQTSYNNLTPLDLTKLYLSHTCLSLVKKKKNKKTETFYIFPWSSNPLFPILFFCCCGYYYNILPCRLKCHRFVLLQFWRSRVQKECNRAKNKVLAGRGEFLTCLFQRPEVAVIPWFIQHHSNLCFSYCLLLWSTAFF